MARIPVEEMIYNNVPLRIFSLQYLFCRKKQLQKKKPVPDKTRNLLFDIVWVCEYGFVFRHSTANKGVSE